MVGQSGAMIQKELIIGYQIHLLNYNDYICFFTLVLSMSEM